MLFKVMEKKGKESKENQKERKAVKKNFICITQNPKKLD